jgi:hypothetical protein
VKKSVTLAMSPYQITIQDGEETQTFDITPEEIRLLKEFFKMYTARPLQRKSKLKHLQSYI